MATVNPPKDLPREELMKLARETLERYPGAELHFKFTCEHCGERCTLQDPGVLYESGICFKCGRETTITHGGFMVAMEYKGDAALSSSWNHSICESCWRKQRGAEEPYRIREEFRDEKPETCCYCGYPHNSGIYVREDYHLLRCGGIHQ